MGEGSSVAGRTACAAAPGPVRVRMFMRSPRQPPDQPRVACYEGNFGKLCEALHTTARNNRTTDRNKTGDGRWPIGTPAFGIFMAGPPQFPEQPRARAGCPRRVTGARGELAVMVDRTVLATSLGGIALASVPLMGSTSVAVAACVGVQASDCMLHYGPVAESSYKDT